ncbi:MAG: hypothetical protein AAF533_29400, partial [Acidobacteriota bacterium]
CSSDLCTRARLPHLPVHFGNRLPHLPVLTPTQCDAHRVEDRHGWQSFEASTSTTSSSATSSSAVEKEDALEELGAEKLLPTPLPVELSLPRGDRQGSLRLPSPEARQLGLPTRIVTHGLQGPLRFRGGWWPGGQSFDRDEFLLEGADGGFYRVFRDREKGGWNLLGWKD